MCYLSIYLYRGGTSVLMSPPCLSQSLRRSWESWCWVPSCTPGAHSCSTGWTWSTHRRSRSSSGTNSAGPLSPKPCTNIVKKYIYRKNIKSIKMLQNLKNPKFGSIHYGIIRFLIIQMLKPHLYLMFCNVYSFLELGHKCLQWEFHLF